MTNQEVFDKVWDWFVVQKKPQSGERYYDLEGTETLSCSYRGAKGQRCAVGVLIPDELYKQDFEKKNVEAVIKQNRSMRDFFEGVTTELLSDCQFTHDECYLKTKEGFTNHMRRGLQAIAIKYNLQVPVE